MHGLQVVLVSGHSGLSTISAAGFLLYRIPSLTEDKAPKVQRTPRLQNDL